MANTVACAMSRLPWCCGVIEAGYFRPLAGMAGVGPDRINNAKDASDLLRRILEKWKGYPVMFNFYREIEYDDCDEPMEEEEYQAADLREEVMKHPQAKNLATFVNPNSGNRVDSWMIFTGEIPYEAD